MSRKNRSITAFVGCLLIIIYAVYKGWYLLMTGMFLMTVGSGLNLVAVLANNGVMPILVAGMSKIFQHGGSEDRSHRIYCSFEGVRFVTLCDRFNFIKIKDNKYILQSYSIGDFLIYSGAILAMLGIVSL